MARTESSPGAGSTTSAGRSFGLPYRSLSSTRRGILRPEPAARSQQKPTDEQGSPQGFLPGQEPERDLERVAGEPFGQGTERLVVPGRLDGPLCPQIKRIASRARHHTDLLHGPVAQNSELHLGPKPRSPARPLPATVDLVDDALEVLGVGEVLPRRFHVGDMGPGATAFRPD